MSVGFVCGIKDQTMWTMILLPTSLLLTLSQEPARRGKKKKQNLSPEDRKRYIKWDAVMHTLPNVKTIEKRDAVFLVGCLAGLDELHVAHIKWESGNGSRTAHEKRVS